MSAPEGFRDVLNRPYAGYRCGACNQPVVLRIGFHEDECQGCGARFRTRKFYASREDYDRAADTTEAG